LGGGFREWDRQTWADNVPTGPSHLRTDDRTEAHHASTARSLVLKPVPIDNGPYQAVVATRRFGPSWQTGLELEDIFWRPPSRGLFHSKRN